MQRDLYRRQGRRVVFTNGCFDLLHPQVYVKGGGHREDTLPEAPVVRAYGGQVRVLPPLAEGTTTTLIRRIRSAEVVAAS